MEIKFWDVNKKEYDNYNRYVIEDMNVYKLDTSRLGYYDLQEDEVLEFVGDEIEPHFYLNGKRIA